jgi:hypothetical protein
MNFFKRLLPKKPLLVQPVINGPVDLRIKIINNRYFPQKKINGKWVNILCTNELGWYKAPKLFNGYDGQRNAEINIECAEKYTREAYEYYR